MIGEYYLSLYYPRTRCVISMIHVKLQATVSFVEVETYTSSQTS